ncbi:hypothetical protein C0J52_22286 [Blattella germanica]|nr:hypothetical protein C0J52_22286 [Blattella germanica]
MTALRLVQRMKRDSIHTGRRPSGLCGAETPSSSLTLDEFMTVDLEEEQDPPSFKAAQIEAESDHESQDADNFIVQSTLGIIQGCIDNDDPTNSMDDRPEVRPEAESVECNNGEIDLEGIDDDEIDSYIMTEQEAQYKDTLWNKINAEYLKEVKEKEEKLAKEKEEGKPEKKKRKPNQRKPRSSNAANSAGEAIEKMLQEKKISSKINYDVLKSLNVKSLETPPTPTKETNESSSLLSTRTESTSLFGSPERRRSEISIDKLEDSVPKSKPIRAMPRTDISQRRNKVSTEPSSPVAAATAEEPQQTVLETTDLQPEAEMDEVDEYEEEQDNEPEPAGHMSLAEMLNHHREDDDYYGGYDYDEY